MNRNLLSPCVFARAAFIAFIFLLSATASATSPIGATPGAFAVSPTGAATYTIPIAVPPGTAGMEPKLALSYNSQGGNGLLGMGWSLSGLSAITRCPKTVAQDGMKGSVNFDANDRFCLDGQRLVAIAGAYGVDGTEYRTEIESFSRIISYGTTGSGPAWFKVWTKSGQILEFGNTADSSILAQGKSTVAVWAIKKISDTVGNYFTVTYVNNGGDHGEYYPSRIDYTSAANASKTITCNSATPCASVQFVYTARPDITPLYQAGSMTKYTMLLSDIKTYSGTTLVRDYKLAYGLNSANNTSRLGSITECVGDGACLHPTQFAWQPESAGFISQPSTWWPSSGSWCDPAHLKYGDFNSDGKTDMMCNSDLPDGRHLVAFSNGDGSFSAPGGWWPGYGAWCDPAHLQYGDFNGDGKVDMICNSDDGKHIIAFSNGDGTFSSPGWWATVWCDPGHLAFGDFNGDGKTDMLCNADAGWHAIAFSNGDGAFSAPSSWPSSGAWCDPAHLQYGDFNGDGKLDMMCNADAGWHAIAFSNGDGAFSAPSSWPSSGAWCDPAHLQYGDFNGDGKLDMMCNADDGNHIIAFSEGDGAFTSPGWMPSAWCAPSPTTTLLSHTVRLAISSPILVYGDFNGDGKTDLVCNNTAGLHLVALEDPVINVVASVTNGLAVASTITYKPLTDGAVYTKGSGAVYPTVDIQAPIHVVSRVSSSNGVGGTFDTDYTYGGAKADLSGHGFLGFTWQQALNTGTNIAGYTEYAQSFPYIGIPTKATTKLGSQVLKQTTNTLATFGPQQYTGVYFPYISQSVETANDLNGAALPTVTTSTAYDAYGNPANITVSTGDGYSKTTVNTYDNTIDATHWFLGRLRRSTVTSTTP